MDKIKNIIIICLSIIIMIIMLTKGCKTESIITNTTTITKIDTVFSKDTVYKLKTIIKPVPVNIYLDPSPVDTNICKYLRIYRDSIIDTNQILYYDITTKGKLDSLKLSYKLKIPLRIFINTTNTITNTVTQLPKWSLYGGLELGGNKNTFNFSPFIGLNMKNKNIYYRYGVLSNTHNIGVGINFLKSKK